MEGEGVELNIQYTDKWVPSIVNSVDPNLPNPYTVNVIGGPVISNIAEWRLRPCCQEKVSSANAAWVEKKAQEIGWDQYNNL